jgi:hypothetical protein
LRANKGNANSVESETGSEQFARKNVAVKRDLLG